METEAVKIQNPLVSIVVVSYNCEEVIAQCVHSCFRSNNVELIIIDNASKDSTVAIVKSLTDSRLVLIENTTNLGFTRACNQGIRRATGQYVMLLNPDAILQADTLSILSAYLDSHADVGIVAPCLYYPNGEFQNYTRTFPTVGGLWVESFIPMTHWNRFKSYRQYTCQEVDFSVAQQVEQPAGAALLLREKWLLDEHYFIYGSDVDLCKTVMDSGYKIVQLPQAQVVHHQSKGGTENPQLRIFLDLDNYYGMCYYFKKHREPLNAFLYRFVFSISLFARFLLSLFSDAKARNMRFKKFSYFIKNKNFTAIYDVK